MVLELSGGFKTVWTILKMPEWFSNCSDGFKILKLSEWFQHHPNGFKTVRIVSKIVWMVLELVQIFKNCPESFETFLTCCERGLFVVLISRETIMCFLCVVRDGSACFIRKKFARKKEGLAKYQNFSAFLDTSPRKDVI